mmetsp:Transcript_32502/g.55370  ORF Transcript_32502/g.55370 Transcript_32502/m.55370 type:complete len:471 (-) Transcript_32502:138-1550(-)
MVIDKLPDDPNNQSSESGGTSTRVKLAAWRKVDFDILFRKLVQFKEENPQVVTPPQKHPEIGRWVAELRANKKILRERGLEYEPEDERREGEADDAAMGEGGGDGDDASSPKKDRRRKDPRNANTYLSRTRVAHLDAIGFVWTVVPPRVGWEQRLEQLKQYRAQHGKFPSNKDGTLGNWLKQQRKLYSKKDAEFMATRCAKLEEIGVSLRQRNYTALSWEDRFQQLVEFGRVNRHFNVPNPAPDNGEGREMLKDLSSDVADAQRFYKFVKKIQTDYRALQRGLPCANNMLNEERIAQLQNIGFEFTLRPDKIVPEVDWSTRIQQLEAFQSEMGHLRVDPNYDKYSNLGGWAVEMSERHQRWQEGREYLSPDMIEKFNQLTSMGFGFDVFKSRRGERSWEDSFGLLLMYRQETGSTRVPHHYKADFRLGSWVAVQRKEYKLLVEGKPSRMTHERINKLESIGFEWVARRGD